MGTKKVTRKTWAKIGQILAIIGAILLLVQAILAILGTTISGLTNSFLPIGGIIGGIISIVFAIIVLMLELDKIVISSHLVRGIVYIVISFLGPFNILILLAGIFYIVAEFLDK